MLQAKVIMQGMRMSLALATISSIFLFMVTILLSSTSMDASREAPSLRENSLFSLRHGPHSQHFQPPPQPPPLEENDELYGVDKRLVPSGPNPLHNR